jgi:UDP-N-acetyl-D-galactosamine dehydrogenase
VASQIIKTMIRHDIKVHGSEVLMLGITFKENCPDVRNTKIVDVIKALEDYGIKVTVHDPWANPAEVEHEYGLKCLNEMPVNAKFDSVVVGVAHEEFLTVDLSNNLKEVSVLYDVKGILANSDSKL